LPSRIRQEYSEGRFTTFPPADSPAAFSFILGSCNLHSLGLLERPDRAWLEISSLGKAVQARFMMHCGDQIYADIPLRPSIDIQHFRDKYLDAWEDCVPARKTLTEMPHYMILDDHELINDFDRGNPDTNNQLALAAITAYWEFQHSHNPANRHPEHHYHYEFNYAAARFFVMDTRFYRNSAQGRMIDEVQFDDLLKWLVRFKNDLKFIVTSVPFVGVPLNPEGDKWCDVAYRNQRAQILAHILDNQVTRIVFLTGDMHTSYHATLDVSRGERRMVLHELMSSPINQITPNLKLQAVYDTRETVTELGNGIQVRSRITPESFYGKHSNVMVVNVDTTHQTPKVGYQIHRTTRSEAGPTGSFEP
jgi:phosphodiesterase/alkaline phosphatase D-like protein